MVWDCFAETIEPIAIFIFPHTSQQELITLLLRRLLEKVECEKNYIRRSAATILASSVVHSRLPHELSYQLIQQLIGRVLVLKQRFLSGGPTARAGGVAMAAVGLQGCLCTLRNLASLYSRIPATVLVNERNKTKGRPSPSTYLAAPLVAMGVETADFVSWSRESLEFFWWSAVRLLCLQLACRKYQTTSSSMSASSSVMVCTAALECLLEILSSTPAGRPPTELPEGFQEVLRIFCSMKKSHSPSAALHLDDYESSVDASDADDGSSIASQSTMPLNSTILESGGEKISLVKRNLIPTAPSTPAQQETEALPNGLPSSQADATDEMEPEDENEILATSMHSFLGLFAHRFGLMSGAPSTARAAAQSLAVACLAKLSLTLPPGLFFEPLQPTSQPSEEEDEAAKSVTGIEMALHLMHHSDPQVRGNACLLVGNILHSTSTHALIKSSSGLDVHKHLQIYRLVCGLDDLLASEKSGITYRMALKALRSCANTLLHLPAVVPVVDMETESVSVRLLQCLAARLVDSTRHPYRLVRRETLFLVASLDWDQLEHLERAWFGRHRNGTSKRLVEATPLSIVAWNECLRLFADADRSLGREAFHSLLALSRRVPSADLQKTQMNDVDLESIDTAAVDLFESSALTGQNVVACDLPVAQDCYFSTVSGFADDLLCVTKDLPVYLRFSAPPSLSTQEVKPLPPHRSCLWRQRRRRIRGLHRVFRELVDSLLELSPICDSQENRSMMHSLIFGLAELLGRPPITSNHVLWYTPSPLPQSLDTGNENTTISPAHFALQHYQRRPKMALLLWHCISQLSISPLALTDLALQAELLCLASGCALRWGVSSLLEGSIPAGGKMELHQDHAFTRASGALLKHVIKLLAIFWHVFKGAKPNSAASAASILSSLVGGNSASSPVPIASAPIGGPAASPSTVTTTINTSQTKSRPIFGLQFIQTTEAEEEGNRLLLGGRETHGYFADSQQYMQLYNTIRTSFEAFKVILEKVGTASLMAHHDGNFSYACEVKRSGLTSTLLPVQFHVTPVDGRFFVAARLCACGRVSSLFRTSNLPKMEQAPDTGQQVYNPRHNSDVVHRPFDLQLDVDLYINLENLPPNTPMMAFGNDYDQPIDQGINIPLFIAGPMVVLRDIITEPGVRHTDDFIDELDFSLIYDPTPFEPQCEVCDLVQWLLTECQNYGQCLSRLFVLRQIIIFEIMREIWCRLRPKPLAFSGRHLDQALRVNYIALPGLTAYPVPLPQFTLPIPMHWLQGGREVSLEWTYGFMFLTHEDIESAGELAPVSCFIFANLIQLLRLYVESALPTLPVETNSRLYILDAIWTSPTTVLPAVMKLARSIFLTLVELEGDWLPDPHSPPPPDFRREQSPWYRRRMRRIVENMLTMNAAELFHNGANPGNFYQHNIDCEIFPQLCPCRFARYLESTL
ncbi:hypothetical protein TcWFU_005808 [Taenia crassiceps]|uniref:Uncharacterized protein n=1 Tax=Taenia crassiceps TaxID=6207 RepID=A0ABR4QC19_9CEST